jgi:hypothetical protein
MSSDPRCSPEADRRGRRGSIVAVGVAILVLILFRSFGWEWYERTRYLTLREHELRRDRFEIERLIAGAAHDPLGGALLVTFEGVPWPADSALGVATPVLDSLFALGEPMDFEPVGEEDPVIRLATEVAVRCRANGWLTAAVTGPARPPAEHIFDWVERTPPRITGYHHEADATWSTVAALRMWERPRSQPLLLWVRYEEALPPHLPRRDYTGRSAWANEVEAIDDYLGRLLRGLRSRGPRLAVLVVLGDRPEIRVVSPDLLPLD